MELQGLFNCGYVRIELMVNGNLFGSVFVSGSGVAYIITIIHQVLVAALNNVESKDNILSHW